MQVFTLPNMSFAHLNRGMKAKVVAMHNHDGIERLMEMGLTVGTEFEVEKVAPLGDTIEIRLRGYSLCLRKCEAKTIEIEMLG